MELRLSIIIILLSVIFTLIIINMVRKEELDLKYALIWILMFLCILILDLVPNLMKVIANLFGIVTPIYAIFFMGFVFLLSIIFALTVATSRSSKRITRLTQEIALLKEKIEK